MRRPPALLALAVLSSSLGAAPELTPPEPAGVTRLLGIWEGKLKVATIELRLIFRVEPAPDGAVKATMESPDQGAKDIAVESATIEGDTATFEVKLARGRFVGKLDAGRTQIDGTWSQSGLKLPLVVRRVEKPTEAGRPQTPRPPFPYASTEVTYPNADAKTTLAGTLTAPNGPGPFPAAILISGSGAQDRDETIFGHKPFLVLADFLARRGVAVLRVDDRGVGGSTGSPLTATSEDFAVDVEAGMAFLKARAEIDPARIGLIGHSEGGYIAPMIAARRDDVAFLVLLAGTGLTGREIVLKQTELILKQAGVVEAEIERTKNVQDQLYATIAADKNEAERSAAVKAVIDSELAKIPEDKRADARPAIEAQIEIARSPWFRFFLTYDPRPALAKVKCPVLALNGERDSQVPARANLDAIAAALKSGGNDRSEAIELPGLNHLFQHAETGAPSEYANIEETIAPEALKAIADWVVARVGAK